MSWQKSLRGRKDNGWKLQFQRPQPEDSARAADLAESVVPGAEGLVVGLLRARRELLQGIASVVRGQIAECDAHIAAVTDETRERWTGGVPAMLRCTNERAADAAREFASKGAQTLRSVADAVETLSTPANDKQVKREKLSIEE